MTKHHVNLWLDDIRPAPDGWLHVRTVAEAKEVLSDPQIRVIAWSLDHDLGACEVCLEGKSAEEWLEAAKYQSMPNCSHYGTGYDLICWLEENPQYWPKKVPSVHSANPVGRDRMKVVIRKHYGTA